MDYSHTYIVLLRDGVALTQQNKAGRGTSIGSGVHLACKRPRVRSPRPAYSFVVTWSQEFNENLKHDMSFIFSCTEGHTVSKIIDKLKVKKATGVDKISCKILKLAKTALQSPLTGLINLSVRTSTFPGRIKRAQMSPLLKKIDPMDKTNYRPVNILPVTSKIYENILSQQLSAYFETFSTSNCVLSGRDMAARRFC